MKTGFTKEEITELMAKPWNYPIWREKFSSSELIVLGLLNDVLFEVQYAQSGNKTAKRKEAAETFLKAMQMLQPGFAKYNNNEEDE